MKNIKTIRTSNFAQKEIEALSEEILSSFKKLGDKSSSFEGSFKMTASTPTKDRHGEIILSEAWDIKNYLDNPVVLWQHNRRDLPIGKADKVYLENNNLVIEGRFFSKELNPLSQQIRKMYDVGGINTVSVGFDCKKFDMETSTCLEAELHEVSFVTVPANPEARRRSVELDYEDFVEMKDFAKELTQTIDFVIKAKEPSEKPEKTPKEGDKGGDDTKPEDEITPAEKREMDKNVKKMHDENYKMVVKVLDDMEDEVYNNMPEEMEKMYKAKGIGRRQLVGKYQDIMSKSCGDFANKLDDQYYEMWGKSIVEKPEDKKELLAKEIYAILEKDRSIVELVKKQIIDNSDSKSKQVVFNVKDILTKINTETKEILTDINQKIKKY